MDDIKQKTIRSLFWKFLERAGYQIIALIVQIVLARLLTPEDFGMIAILAVFINVGNVFVQSGLNTALIQFPDVEEKDYSTVFWLCFAISIVLYVVLFFCAPAIATYYEAPQLTWPLRVFLLVLIINSLNSIQVARLTRELDFKKIFHATMACVIVSGAIGIAMAAAGFGIWALVGQQVSFQLVNCLVLYGQMRWLPYLHFEADRALAFFRFGWKLLVSALLDVGYQSLSDLIIGKQFSKTELGYVSQGKKYPYTLGALLDGAIQSVMLSAISRIQEDRAYVKRLVRRALKTSSFIVFPVMGAMGLCAEPLIYLLLGEQWLPAVPFFQMYCFVYALWPIHTSNLQAINGVGRSDLFLILEVIKTALGVGILLFCVFYLQDIYAVVAGYMVAGVISVFINAFPNRKIIGYAYREQFADIAPAALLTAVGIGAGWLLTLTGIENPWVLLIGMCVIFSVVYLGAAKLLHVEAFEYILENGKEIVQGKLNASNDANEPEA